MVLSENWEKLISNGKLCLGLSNIGTEDAKLIAANTTITTLHLASNHIGIDGIRALAANKSITTLYIAGNYIGDEGARVLSANTMISTLDISGNQIGNEGAKALAVNNTITTLYFSLNWIGDTGIIALHEWQSRRESDGKPVAITGVDLSAKSISQAKRNIATKLLENQGLEQAVSGRTPK